MQKSWLWPNHHGGVEGAVIDLEEARVQWYDQPGCACGGSDSEQKIADFLARGPRFIMPPQDIIEEMQAFIHENF